jgi:dihydroorotate dehydrogenase
VRNLECSRFQGVLGINIGKNKDTPNERAVDDYLLCLERVYPLATYITVNISSPNTQGLRDLQEETTLRALHRHSARGAGETGREAPPAQADAAEDRAGPDAEAEMDASPRCCWHPASTG